jgi:hypothetical protein
METFDYIVKKYNLNVGQQQPIQIQGMLRSDLAIDFCNLGFTVGVEVGVARGKFSEVLCGANPGLRLYSVDPWQAYKGYRDYLDQERLDGFYGEAKARLARFPNCTLVRKFSMDALADFADGSLDFVYIDGNHEIPWVLDDICWWSTKVRPGGIVAGHDYFESHRRVRTQVHVKYAVDCCARSLWVNTWFMVGADEDWDKLFKAGERPSWFWIKNEKQWTLSTI